MAAKLPEFFIRYLDSELPANRFRKLAADAGASGFIGEIELKELAAHGITALVNAIAANRKVTKGDADRIAELRDAFGLAETDLGAAAAGTLMEARGSAFMASPRPKGPSIPTITVQDLIDALNLYLSTITTYTPAMAGVGGNRTSRSTTISLYGQVEQKLGRRIKIAADFFGKATYSSTAELWSEQFVIYLRSDDIDLGGMKHGLIVEPQADRSIAIFRITRWENGEAHYDRPLALGQPD